MKKLGFIVVFLICFIYGNCQDTLYIFKTGYVVTKCAVSDIDSITFNAKANTEGCTVTLDYDGNCYHEISLGNQIWMLEDLKTTHYRNGDLILTSKNDIANETLPKYQWPCVGFESYVHKYGRYYTWFAVNDSRGIAPIGWHVASVDEWDTLQNYLIRQGFNYDQTKSGNKIANSLSTGNTWNYSQINGTPGYNMTLNNSTGFTMYPNGVRSPNGVYSLFGIGSDIWTSSEATFNTAYYRGCAYNSSSLNGGSNNKNYGFTVRCIRNTVPVVLTSDVFDITDSSAISGGIITSDGGEVIIERGICWSTTSLPTISDNKTTDSLGVGLFTSKMKYLQPNTTYYVRAFASNRLGISYGKQVSFLINEEYTKLIKDVDGNTYHSIKIGNQVWLMEDLKTTRYRNGDLIATTINDVSSENEPKYQWPCNGLESNVNTFGRYYTWYAVADNRKIAPEGFHVASVADWDTLQNYLISQGYNYDKSILGNKIANSLSARNTWNYSTTEGTPGYSLIFNNSTGFSMFPNGARSPNGVYTLFGIGSDIWTCSESTSSAAYFRGCAYCSVSLNGGATNKNYGFTVRCIKDQ